MHHFPFDDDFVLPHASLLSYFCLPAPGAESGDAYGSHPSCNGCTHSHTTRLHATDDAKIHDEESKHGFWGERMPVQQKKKNWLQGMTWHSQGRSNRSMYAFCCLWCAGSICILATFSILFALDLAVSPLGLGTGVAQRIIHSHSRSTIAQHALHFCLATPNRDAPGPQSWRYLAPNSSQDCTTEILTLVAGGSEYMKIFSGDEVLFRDKIRPINEEEGTRRFTSVEEKIRAQEVGDDLAQEGLLEQTDSR